jgi:hypothetical protein
MLIYIHYTTLYIYIMYLFKYFIWVKYIQCDKLTKKKKLEKSGGGKCMIKIYN